MKNVLKLFVVALVLLVTSCGEVIVNGEGNIVTQEKQVSDFSAVKISAPINAEIIIQPGVPTVSLSGYENLLKHLIVKTNGSTLEISTDVENISWNTDKDVVATITVPSLNNIDLNGAVDAKVTGMIKSGELSCDLSGATSLLVDGVEVIDLNIDISGAGELKIKTGQAHNVQYDISGNGNVEAYGLQSSNVRADLSGASELQITALKTLNAEISGAGNISYKGNPTIQTDISGAGEVNAAN